MMSKRVLLPIHLSSPGTPAPVWTVCSCHTFANPRTTKLMARVMISGCTRNTPTPMPVTRPASAAAASAMTIPWTHPPGLWTNVAVTNPAIEATAATDRSIPPVSIVSVWQPPRMANGTEARKITPHHGRLTMPGSATWIVITRRRSRPVRGMRGRSRNRFRQAAVFSHALVRTAAVMPGSFA